MTNYSRQDLVDRLRGYALLGVVVVNAPFLISSTAGTTAAGLDSDLDRAAAVLAWTVFQGKAYLVFAFLFGYSLTIFLTSATAKGLRPIRTYLQRLAALFVIGCLHAVLLFPGDILVVYAVLGLMLIGLLGCSDRALLVLAVVCGLLQVVLLALLAVVPAERAGGGSTSSLDERLGDGGLAAAVAAHLDLWPGYLVLMILLQGALVASMFCLGLLGGRRGLLQEVGPHRRRWRQARRWGIVLGLPPQAASAWLALHPGATEEQEYLALVLQYLTAPVLSVGLVAAVVLAPRRGLTRLVEADGRMSLTVYLGESLVLAALGAGWGGGLLGLSAATTLLVALGTWLLLLGFAHAWHGRALGAGPAERVLRRATYAGART